MIAVVLLCELVGSVSELCDGVNLKIKIILQIIENYVINGRDDDSIYPAITWFL